MMEMELPVKYLSQLRKLDLDGDWDYENRRGNLRREVQSIGSIKHREMMISIPDGMEIQCHMISRWGTHIT
jgi:hypothetical protein